MHPPFLYINTPFCTQLCTFCNFYKNHIKTYHQYFSPEAGFFHEAIIGEFEQVSRLDQWPVMQSLYIGGGSPMEMPAFEIPKLLEYLHQKLDLSQAEITIELNPFFPQEDYLDFLKKPWINRVSLGIQSFSPTARSTIGRPHHHDPAFIEFLKSRDLRLSLDLLLDIPDWGFSGWLNDLKRALELDPGHLSCYGLELDKPNIHRQIQGEQKEEDYLLSYEHCLETCENHGYQQYELSNFAKSGLHSKHNLAYWQQRSGIGLGPGAYGTVYHSSSATRRMNHKHLKDYLRQIKEGLRPSETIEDLDPTDLLNETIMLSLRQNTGLGKKSLTKNEWETLRLKISQVPKTEEFFIMQEESISLTMRGKLYFNTLVSNLFF